MHGGKASITVSVGISSKCVFPFVSEKRRFILSTLSVMFLDSSPTSVLSLFSMWRRTSSSRSRLASTLVR